MARREIQEETLGHEPWAGVSPTRAARALVHRHGAVAAGAVAANDGRGWEADGLGQVGSPALRWFPVPTRDRGEASCSGKHSITIRRATVYRDGNRAPSRRSGFHGTARRCQPSTRSGSPPGDPERRPPDPGCALDTHRRAPPTTRSHGRSFYLAPRTRGPEGRLSVPQVWDGRRRDGCQCGSPGQDTEEPGAITRWDRSAESGRRDRIDRRQASMRGHPSVCSVARAPSKFRKGGSVPFGGETGMTQRTSHTPSAADGLGSPWSRPRKTA